MQKSRPSKTTVTSVIRAPRNIIKDRSLGRRNSDQLENALDGEDGEDDDDDDEDDEGNADVHQYV